MDLTAMSLEQKIDYLVEKQIRMEELLARVLPLLERYERAAKAHNVFQARKILKESAVTNG